MYEGYNQHLEMHRQLTNMGGIGGLNSLVKPQTLRESIETNIKAHESEVARNRELLKLLDENPAIEKFMNLSRGTF